MSRQKLIELARQGREMPGGPTGALHECERRLAELGIAKLVAPRRVYLRVRGIARYELAIQQTSVNADIAVRLAHHPTHNVMIH